MRVTGHELLALVERQPVPVVVAAAALRHRIEAQEASLGQPRVQPVVAVVLDPVPPHHEPLLDLGRIAELFFVAQPRPLVVLGGRVLGELRQRDVGVVGDQRAGEQLLLEGVQPGQIRAEGHHPEIGLVAEHREHQRLVTVCFERRDGVHDPLRRAGILLRPLAVDSEEQVQHTPPDRRRHRLDRHGRQATGRATRLQGPEDGRIDRSGRGNLRPRF